jgi:hypothetical protein
LLARDWPFAPLRVGRSSSQREFHGRAIVSRVASPQDEAGAAQATRYPTGPQACGKRQLIRTPPGSGRGGCLLRIGKLGAGGPRPCDNRSQGQTSARQVEARVPSTLRAARQRANATGKSDLGPGISYSCCRPYNRPIVWLMPFCPNSI